MLRAARDIAAELIATPVTADELQRATGPAAEQIVRASSGNVFWMFETEGATRDPRVLTALRSYLSDLTRVTPAEIQGLAARYLAPGRGVPVLILPESGAGEAAR
jgi:zinc protease